MTERVVEFVPCLLVEAGVHILEMMDLAELAADAVWEFLFVLTPLKVVGATGVPVRPEWFSDQFRRLSRAAGVPVVRLHATRYTLGRVPARAPGGGGSLRT